MDRPENSEEQFEKEWRDAFEGASQSPPPAVWSEIDRQLTHAELSTYKSKAIFYRWAVAAVVVLAAALGTWQYYYFQQLQGRLYSNAIDIDKPDPINGFAYNWNRFEWNDNRTENSNSKGAYLNARNENRVFQNKSRVAGNNDGSNVVTLASGPVITDDSEEIDGVKRDSWSVRKKEGLIENAHLAVNINEPNKIPVYHYEAQRLRKSSESDKYFAGVSFGSGGFNPNYESTSGSLLAGNLDVNPSAFSLADNEAINGESPSVREGMLPGESMSLGLNFGLKLSDRWSLESGVQYARAGATTQTNIVIQTSTWQESIPATSQVKGNKQFETAVQREEIVEYDYRDLNLRNEFQFTSVPLKAGYMVLNKKFRVEVNAGVIANFYMGNKLTGHEEEIAQLTIGPGSQSPYRELSFSGLAGVELGYRLLKNFDVVLEPNYRQALNSLTKDDATFLTNPSGFGIMTGIKYNFN